MKDSFMKTHYPVVVVGGGQAGLALSYCLKERGIEHVVFEKDRAASAWRSSRWDSFCLVTPNWQCRLPGFPYCGNDPHGFMLKDEIVQYIEDYVMFFDPPLREGVEVARVAAAADGRGFAVVTSTGELHADNVVVAIGGYHSVTLPRLAERLAPDIVQLHSSQYKNPQALPPGAVLVVGTGQSGCQIAEDLHLAGRRVHLCVGSAPRVARRYRGKDVVDWLDDLGYYDLPVHDHPLKEAIRSRPNHYVTGRDGGRDIDLRQFAREGMQLHGRLRDIRGGVLCFAPDLKQNLDNADTVADNIKNTIDAHIAKHGIEAPVEARYVPVWEPDGDLGDCDYRAADIAAVIWSTGFAANFRFIDVPAFDGKGYPTHQRGVTSFPGLYFLGLPWLYTWGSGRFSGIARDAGFVADHIAHGGLSARFENHARASEAERTPVEALASGS
jgi:putative flavoprotein involved in K+ transport